uniref:Uncharacterized protein n=1 Tax=Ixodes ricinus TaxID=34613 RepID=A0A6B0TSG3_IXORI
MPQVALLQTSLGAPVLLQCHVATHRSTTTKATWNHNKPTLQLMSATSYLLQTLPFALLPTATTLPS